MNRLIRSTASPAHAKIEAQANRTAHCDKFLPCRFDRACLIEAPDDGNEPRTGCGPRSPRGNDRRRTERRIVGARRKASLAFTAARSSAQSFPGQAEHREAEPRRVRQYHLITASAVASSISLYRVAIMDWAEPTRSAAERSPVSWSAEGRRAVLSWRLSTTMDAAFCGAALKEALARDGKPAIFNTDQGSRFIGSDIAGILATGSRSRWRAAAALWPLSSRGGS